MSPSLDPLIAERLRAFAQRWMRMVWTRGVCAAAVTLLIAFTAVAWIDRFLVLTEGTRWLLSLGGYVATALAFWLVAGRLLAEPPSTREFAVLMEKAWPGLRSHLVAAVELAEKSADGKNDSFAFRDLVQDGVARRVRDLRMEVVLPRAHVAVWVRGALGSLSVVAVMFAVPSLEFPRQLARAFLPMAAIERVARTKIRVLEPAADTRWLAQGDHQPVVVELAGADTGRAELEVVADGKAERVQMSSGNGGQFTAMVPVGQGAFAFRVRAGDALTKMVTIATRARPAVVAFVKTYEAPAYAQLAARSVEEEHGNLSALEGSVADLRMRVNQSVRAGELAIVADGQTNLVALTAPEPGIVHARIPVRGAATYQVRLAAAETGLANKFSPTFEIRAEPDLAPRVTLESPRNDSAVSSDEVILVRGTAGDDIGLAAAAQQFQINAGPWLEVPLALANKTNTPVTHRWDLLLLGLSTGDRLVTKLVAVDLKGTRVESAIAQLVIGAEQSDSTRAKALAARQQVQEALEAAGKAAGELRKAYTAESAAKILAGDDVQRKLTVAGAAVALADVERQLERADRQLAGAMQEADAGRESAELASMASALSAARRELLPRAQADRESLARELREPPERSNIGEAMKSSQRLADYTAQMAASHNELVAADQADALTERLDLLAKGQQRVQQTAENAGSDTNAWQRVARRQTSASREVAKAEQQMAELRQRAPKQVSDRLGKTQENLKAARSGVEAALIHQAGPELAWPSRQMKSTTEQAASDARVAARELGMRADKARTELARLAESSAEKVARLRKELGQSAASEKRLADAKRSGEEDPKLKVKADADRQRAGAQWRAAMEQLEDRARTEEARRDGDPQFAAQLGQSRDALEAMRAAAEADWQGAANLERLARMEKALRGLESGRQLSELEGAAKALARQERFEANAPDSSTSRPRDWSWMEKQTAAAQREARGAGLGEKTAGAMSEAMRGSAGQQVSREMAERRNGGQRVATPMAEQLDRVAGELQRAQSEAAKAQAEARQVLARTTPSLSERMLGLSLAAAELEAELKRVASTATGSVTTNLHARQMALNLRVGDAASAIRRDGGAQDLSEPAGRERARDADTAVEMLREPPVKAGEALRGAMATRAAGTRGKLLAEAARQDQTLAENLKALAEHYRNLEAGAADASRAALRKQEDALGTRAKLDERYGRMERLQRLASLPPEEMQRELAAELQRNPAMREELARMSREAVGEARQRLQAAAEAERTLARQLERVANPALEAGELWEQLRQLVEAMRKTAKDEIPPVQADAEKLRVAVKDEFERGTKAIVESADGAPTQTNLPPATVAQRVAEMLPGLQRATNELANAERKVADGEKKFSDAQKKLAEARREAAAAAEWSKAIVASGQVTATVRQQLQRARALAEGFANVGKTTPEQAMARAAQQQDEVAGQLRGAAENLQRASRNEQAMGNQQNAQSLQQSARQAQTGADQADRARRAAQDGQQGAAQAGQSAAQMGNQLEQQRAGLEQSQGSQSGNQQSANQSNAGRMNAQSGSESAQAQPASSQQDAGQQNSSQQNGGLQKAGQSAGAQPSGGQQGSQPNSGQPGGQSGSGKQGQQAGQSGSSSQGSPQGKGGSGPGGGPSADSSSNGSGSPPPGQAGPAGSSGNAQKGSAVQGQAASAPPAQGRGGGGPNNNVSGATGPAQRLNGTMSGSGGAQSAQGATQGMQRRSGAIPSGAVPLSGEPGTMAPGRNFQPDARWMARAMDGMNTGSPTAQADAARALEAARQSRQQAMRQGRGEGQGNGQAGEGQPAGAGRVGGASRAGGGGEFAALPELGELRDADWAKLPPKLAQDLRDAQANGVSGDYRVMVDAYFKALAERARK
ncbi:MAG: hypothetical protein HZA89_14450 [Verrucomicrobia bacterium]|nr:hypothetical protein [Verrucomicrobiota bacterium]